MRKTNAKRLTLNRETLQTLLGDQLDVVYGGVAQQTNETGCTVLSCPPRTCGCPPPPPPPRTQETGCTVLGCPR